MKCHTPLPDNSKFCFACGADQTGGGTSTTTSGDIEHLQNRLQRIVEGKYKIVKMVGKGGMGAVFLAQDLTLDREVAIKVLPPDISADPKVIQRFQQEAKTAAKLDHTNIIPIYRVESEGGLNYFVMKFIAGTSLEDVLEQKQALTAEYIQRVLWEAACALGHAHQRGIVHRDVKPANIMFDHDGRVMLTDFGISKALQAASGFTGTGMIIGTPHYMAPEQAKGQTVDGRADQYSMGVVGYRMITAQLPFSGDSVHTILYKHIFEEAPRTSGIRRDMPPHLSEAIARALAKEPDGRYATMEEFATAVWPEQPVSAPKGGKPGVTSRPRPRPQVTAESPTEAVSAAAPTTPLPMTAPGAKTAARKPEAKKSKAGLFIGFALVAGLGIGGYVMFGPKPATEPPQQVQGTPPVTPPSSPPTPTVADVRVNPGTATLRVGATTELTATPVDAQGNAVTGSGSRVEWSSAAPRIARVDANGRVTAVAPGLAMIEARVGGARGQAAVQVTAPQTAQQPPPRQTPTPPAGGGGAPAEQFGAISVIVENVSATVYVDGVEVGFTPGEFRVRAGPRTIRIEAVGYKPKTERLQVDAGNTVRRRYSLEPEG